MTRIRCMKAHSAPLPLPETKPHTHCFQAAAALWYSELHVTKRWMIQTALPAELKTHCTDISTRGKFSVNHKKQSAPKSILLFEALSCLNRIWFLFTTCFFHCQHNACRDPRDQNRRGNARGDLQGSVS